MSETRTICAWCLADGATEPDIGPHDFISHGICEAHRREFLLAIDAEDALAAAEHAERTQGGRIA